MSPEEIEAIYHQERARAMREAADYSNPVNQRACDLRGWQAVLDAVRMDTEQKLALVMPDTGLMGK